jgi:alpha-amylase
MDYETFGEHQWADTGIFEFLDALPGRSSTSPRPERLPHAQRGRRAFPPVGEYDVPHMISWADTERDLSAWLGNAMQSNALHELYKLEGRHQGRAAEAKRGTGDETSPTARTPTSSNDWRKLTTSDHFYYMCTKYFADGDVHKYFNPYDSPYDATSTS